MPSSTKETVLLAIDPGYDRLGIAILVLENGKSKLLFSDCVETSRKLSHALRLRAIAEIIAETIETYSPTVLGIENLYFSKNQTSALRVAEARGVILAEAARKNLAIIECDPGSVKVAVAGHGKASKDDVMRMIPRLIDMPKKDAKDDEYDAIAIGITASLTFFREKLLQKK